jgi:hypothetical protein
VLNSSRVPTAPFDRQTAAASESQCVARSTPRPQCRPNFGRRTGWTSVDLLQKVAILVLLSVLLVDLGLAQPRVECDRLTGGVASGSAPAAQKGDTNDPAIDACRAALKASPNDPGSMFQFGRSLSACSKHREAIRHFLDAADRGQAGAMTELGLVFEYGWVSREISRQHWHGTKRPPHLATPPP